MAHNQSGVSSEQLGPMTQNQSVDTLSLQLLSIVHNYSVDSLSNKLNPNKTKDILWDLFFLILMMALSGIALFFLIKIFVKFADPTYDKKQKAKKKAKEIMKRLGIKNLKLTNNEFIIASHLVDPNDLKISWEDIAGLDQVINQIKKTVIRPLLAKHQVVSRLIQPPKGVLLYGPPGCGKTLIAKAMTKESGCWFLNLDVSVIADKWYGESQKLTRAVFSLAEKLQPCIIFIDEIDSLLRARQTKDYETTAMMKSLVMSLWDGLITDPNKTVIVMGTTNRPKDIDTAILRRMTVKFHIPIPTRNERKRILELMIRNDEVDKDCDINKLADITDGFSGSDLKEVARSAAVACIVDLRGVGNYKSFDFGPGDKTDNKGRCWWFCNVCRFRGGQITSQQFGDNYNNAIRPITMKEFEIAVMREKEAKRNCQSETHIV